MSGEEEEGLMIRMRLKRDERRGEGGWTLSDRDNRNQERKRKEKREAFANVWAKFI